MKVKSVRKSKGLSKISREQLVRIIYRTMKMERPNITRKQAAEAAAHIRLSR